MTKYERLIRKEIQYDDHPNARDSDHLGGGRYFRHGNYLAYTDCMAKSTAQPPVYMDAADLSGRGGLGVGSDNESLSETLGAAYRIPVLNPCSCIPL
jgi:hypothetical protein